MTPTRPACRPDQEPIAVPGDPGYTGSGTTCALNNPCSATPGPCDTNATCANPSTGNFTCTCKTGYSTTNGGLTCTANNSCNTSNGGCDANATCMSSGPGTNTCACKSGYTGSAMSWTLTSALPHPAPCDPNATCHLGKSSAPASRATPPRITGDLHGGQFMQHEQRRV